MQPQRTEDAETMTAKRPTPQAVAAKAQSFGRPIVMGSGILALGAGLPATPEMLARLEAGWFFDPR